MSDLYSQFQPGAILHEVIKGGFVSQGRSFTRWCRDQGISQATARNATFGQSRGPAGERLLRAMIEAAGMEFVQRNYRDRMKAHVNAIGGGSA